MKTFPPLDWHPHFDFENEVAEHKVTDESYWFDTETGMILGRLNILPRLQERFDHTAFPFDRQVLVMKLLSNNTTFAPWSLQSGEYPPELLLSKDDWQVQAELGALADTWDLHDIQSHIVNDHMAHSAMVVFNVSLQRASSFYVWNIGFVYFLIIAAQSCLFAFPYNESRFNFTMQLALTTVAFQFFSSSYVPKTTYLNTMSKYMLFGLILLGFRIIGDTVLQTFFDRELLVAQEGYRMCDYTNDEGCIADAILTAGLTGVWFVVSFFYLCLGGWWLRPAWRKMSFRQLEGHSKRTGFVTVGKRHIATQDRSFQYQDMSQSAMSLPVLSEDKPRKESDVVCVAPGEP